MTRPVTSLLTLIVLSGGAWGPCAVPMARGQPSVGGHSQPGNPIGGPVGHVSLPAPDGLSRPWSPEGGVVREMFEADRNCGANCLYMLLKVHRPRTTRDEVFKVVPVGEKGSSLLELTRAGDQLGVRLKPVRATPDQLIVSSPAIALMHGSKPDSGHYVLVLNGDGDTVRFIDGTSGMTVMASRADFERAYSGNAVVRSSGLLTPVHWYLLGILGVEGAVIAGFLWRGRRGHDGLREPVSPEGVNRTVTDE